MSKKRLKKTKQNIYINQSSQDNVLKLSETDKLLPKDNSHGNIRTMTNVLSQFKRD